MAQIAFFKNKENIRILFALLFLTLMTLFADLLGNREIIIPEFAALTIGFWVLNKQIWRITALQAIVLLTLTALVSILISIYLPFPLWGKMSVIFLATASLMMLMNVTLSPAFAVGLLPLLMNFKSFEYPIIVFALITIVVLVQWLMNKSRLRTPELLNHPMRNSWKEPLRWCALLLACLPLMISADILEYKFCLAPPFIVAFIELSNSKAGFRNRLIQTWLMLVGAACIGTISKIVLVSTCGLADFVAVFIAESLVFAMFKVAGKYFAPAAALALIPFIMPAESVKWFPLFAIVSTSYYIVLVKLFFIKIRPAK